MLKDVIYAGFNGKFDVAYKKEKSLFPMPPHTHNAIEIFLNLTEIPNVLLGSNMLSLKKNVMLIIPSYCIHQMTQLEDSIYERYILTISTAWFDSLIGDKFVSNYSYFKNSNSPLIISLTEDEKKEIVKKLEQLIKCEDENVFLKTSFFLDVMVWIDNKAIGANDKIENHTTKELNETAKLVSKILDYINENLYENIKIEDIASKFFLNHDYINRIFKKYVNTTIRNYITIQRITKAQQLLLEGYTVSQIQNMIGYGSYEHFFRTFKKNTGMTPKEYKNQYFEQSKS